MAHPKVRVGRRASSLRGPGDISRAAGMGVSGPRCQLGSKGK